MNNEYRLVIFGPQGSGKGTQAEILVKNLKLGYVSTGAIFREAVSQETSLGKKIKQILKEGGLVSDDITNQLVAKALQQADCSHGFILDGYPRNLSQAEFLQNNFSLTHVIEIWISDKEVMERISGRLVCESGGHIYHRKYNPPKESGICDFDQSALYTRDDDTPAAIKRRLDIYHKQTEPLIKYYQERGLHYRIDGEQPIAKVAADIRLLLQYNEK